MTGFMHRRNPASSFSKTDKRSAATSLSQLVMWDAGTEVNQEPGIGPDQGPHQKAPNTGKAENGMVRKIDDGKPYSTASKVMRVTITPAVPAM